MQLILRVTVLAICVLCALALPNFGHKLAYEPNLEAFKVQLQSSKIDTRMMTPTEKHCADTYNNRTQKINDNLIKQTNLCFMNANATMVTNNRTTNATVTSIRKDVVAIQKNLEYCSRLQENMDFLNCITINFDSNLNLLDTTNARAYQVIAQSSADLTQAEVMRQGCTNAAVGNSKIEMTQCASDYNMCLDRIRQQRLSQELGIYG